MLVDIVRSDLTYDTINVYTVNDFPYDLLDTKKHLLVHKKKGLTAYCQTYATFDIEATTINGERPFGFMYHWQMTVGGYTVFGRYWQEWKDFLDKLVDTLSVTSEERLVIYVHNLSYEMQFIKDFLYDWYGDMTVFASQSRKPIYVTSGNGIEFRCSYKLTNMSLYHATKNEWGVVHIKDEEVGFDYKKMRLPTYVMTPQELSYCASDVVSLYELIENRLKNDHDNLETIPLTSTGYVRRDCRRACRADKTYRDYFLGSRMDKQVYELLKEAGRGGNTHANRHVSNRLITLFDCDSIDSFDVASSYPYVMLTKRFPTGRFESYGDVETLEELDTLTSTKACLFRLYLYDVRCKDSTPMPYIPVAKLNCVGDEMLADNGRVLKADSLSITVTDIDWEIIREEYTFNRKKVAVSDMHVAEYDYLPECLRGQILEYYKRKTVLKNQKEALEEREKAGENVKEELKNVKYLYDKSKNRLNGIFGMCYTDPVRDQHIYDPLAEDPTERWTTETADIDQALDKFYRSRNSFLVYAVGVWTTCHARRHLEDLINITNSGDSYIIYCDTDSSKACDVDLAKIESVNDLISEECERMGAYADCEGKRYYLGVYEHENKQSYFAFKTMGAKKYAYVDHKGLHLTVSGVNKDEGAKELGCIKHFEQGFIFEKAGGSTLYYNEGSIRVLTIDGCTFTTASNIGMVDSTYKLGLSDDYAAMLEEFINEY